MVKIKRKVEMTLLELIEYVWKNNIKEKTFYSNLDNSCVSFNRFQTVFIDDPINKDETFTVEVEEEITEDTILPEVVELFTNDDGIKWSENSINDLKDAYSKEFWLKDGNTMTLIWKDGKLV